MFTIYQLVQDFAAIHSMSPFNPQSSAEITVLPRGCHVQPRCLLQTPHLKNVMARCCTYVRAIPPWQKIQLINPKFFVCLPGSNEMIYKTDLFYIWLVVSTPLKKSQLGLLFPIYINILYYMEVNKKCSKPPTSDSKCASKRLILTLQQSSIFPSKTIY